MSSAWFFTEAKPGDKARESKVEDFFKSDAVRDRANALVREGIQNSLDAAPSGSRVNIRIAIGTWSPEEAEHNLAEYERGYREHLAAESVSKKIPGLPGSSDPFRFLVFEDFGTSGLLGDPSEWWPDEHDESGAFFKYFRAEGISGKSDGARGRHGVGRLVFMFASRARMMFGLTRRNVAPGRSDELLMGTAVLRNHRLGTVPYLPDGWFGTRSPEVDGLVLPVDDNLQLEAFKRRFKLARREECGLSVVVPWLSEDVTFEGVLHAVVSEYFYPILSDTLAVEVSEGEERITIDSSTIDSVLDRCRLEFAETCRAYIQLVRASKSGEWLTLNLQREGAPSWSNGVLTDATAKKLIERLEEGAVFLRVPVLVRSRQGAVRESHFEIMLERDPTIGESQIRFIREGIHVSDARPRRTSGLRALIVVEEGSLGEFLGDAENPSHTQWQKDMVRNKYRYHAALINFVVGSVPGLVLEIGRQKEKADSALLLDLFSLPAETGSLRKQELTRPKQGNETAPPKVEVEKKPRSFKVTPKGTGFVVRRGDPSLPPPQSLSVAVAYDVRKGNPFKKYVKADFELGREGVSVSATGCSVLHLAGNSALIRVDGADFAFEVQGLDVRLRDIIVDARVISEASGETIGGPGAGSVQGGA